jgi:hypothetical protein
MKINCVIVGVWGGYKQDPLSTWGKEELILSGRSCQRGVGI